MSAKFIVIEGLDGSGKATQTKILFDKISAMGKSIKRLEFPDYASESSALVKCISAENSAVIRMM